MNTYRIKAYAKGSKEDAIALRNELAQVIYDEFELGGVFGVSVELDTPPQDKYVMALCMVELETSLCKAQIQVRFLGGKGTVMSLTYPTDG